MYTLERFDRLFILILIGEVFLGSIQYVLPGDHILNRFATGGVNEAVVGDAVRVSGTFSFVGGFQAWIIFYGFFLWFLQIRNYPAYLVLIVFGLSLFAALISGSRGSMAMFLATSFFSFLFTGFLLKRFLNFLFTSALIGLLLIIFADNILPKFNRAYINFKDRVEAGQESGELDARIEDSFGDVVNFRGNYPIFGVGLGSTYQGANAIFGESIYVREYGYYESEFARIILEGGYILFFLRIILFIVFLRYSYIPLLGRLLVAALFFNSMIVFNVYMSFFFLLGMMLVDRAYYLNRMMENTD